MAKLIITKDYAQSNLLIELNDGTQIELEVHNGDLIDALKKEGQTVIDVIQNQPVT